MARTQKERSKAFRIRHNETPSQDELEWLMQYEQQSRERQTPLDSCEPGPGGSDELPVAEDFDLPETDEVDAFQYQASESDPKPEQAPLVHALGPAIPTCGKPDCPACSKAVGGHVCSATGQVVWDPVDMDACRGMGKGLLALLGIGASFVRKDKRVILANEREITSMGNALQKATYRRFNALGAIDDILLGVATIGAFGMRALTEPEQTPKKDA